jgi:hypothetical protein
MNGDAGRPVDRWIGRSGSADDDIEMTAFAVRLP